ncbi:Pyruvate carboxylase [Sphaceloma murrayae]|uniref:Pyruvate carboxylase n=1 Tax=Sphaceloma murrayae TaxID=2082308 RepID=A0A2K1QHF1_9PEZI|nr:Pyruvate carboxylase [Sphaceloma murrayae]
MASPRRIKRLLVANRGEIAARVISAARELEIETVALYTGQDVSHAYNADQAIELRGPSSYLDIEELIELVENHSIDAVHPGYGFLSESADFAKRLADAGVLFVGPGFDILNRTGDKLQARKLADECHVPVLPALTTPTSDPAVVRAFARDVGFPIMIKAVDGGGGRGIRLVQEEAALDSSLARAVEESPSRQVFVEKAAVQGYRHIEVQIIGDYHGSITHLWERECSIQRRYQKVVELAPSSLTDRALVARVIEAALRIAKKITYTSLGTFEFLVNPDSREFYFLEINPRLQVEHTVTESICSTDIVRAQILIAQGAPLAESGLQHIHQPPERPPPLHSIQLRITAEDPTKKWSLSIGKIQSCHFPSGNGVRCDTNIINGIPSAVSADFDSLIAKLIVTASSWSAALRKAERALDDTRIVGIQTNMPMLKAILNHADFVEGRCTTSWLESHQAELLSLISQPSPKKFGNSLFATSTASISASPSSSQLLFRKDDAWTIGLSPLPSIPKAPAANYHLHLTRLLKNDFPTSLSAEISITPTSAGTAAHPTPYRLTLNQTSMSSSAASSASTKRRADPANSAHVPIPFAGKLVEVHVDEGDEVQEGETLFVVRQMKMELEVRAHRAGRVKWVMDVQEGEDVAEGWLGAVIDGVGAGGRSKL